MTSTRLRDIALVALPIGVHLAILRHLWFNAPAWDDYGLLADVLWLQDSTSLRQWLGYLFAPANEHRPAFARSLAWTSAAAAGVVDFRSLAFVGALLTFCPLALAWAEFRGKVEPIAFAVAAWALLHWSYY